MVISFKALRSVAILALCTLIIGACSLFDDYDGELSITLSNDELTSESRIDFSIHNEREDSIYIILNGSITNIEQKTDEGWERMPNTLPHHPVIIRQVVKPGEEYARQITYEKLYKLTDGNAEGEYRLAYDYTLQGRGSFEPDGKIVSRPFTVRP